MVPFSCKSRTAGQVDISLFLDIASVLTSAGVTVLPPQELLSLAKRKRSDSEEKEPPVTQPAASSDSETSDSDDEVRVQGRGWGTQHV